MKLIATNCAGIHLKIVFPECDCLPLLDYKICVTRLLRCFLLLRFIFAIFTFGSFFLWFFAFWSSLTPFFNEILVRLVPAFCDLLCWLWV